MKAKQGKKALFTGFIFCSILLCASTASVFGDVSTVTLTGGWATFGLALPQGAATTAVQVGNLPTQIDVKNRWADNSIKFAVVTCKATTTAATAYSITAASSAASGTFTPHVPAASVKFTVNGTLYTATLPQTASADLWLSGANVKEWRAIVVPTTSTGTKHDLLQVVFDVRAYNDNVNRLDVIVENSYDISVGREFTYDVDIIANGQTVYHHAAVLHNWLSRWRKVFELGFTSSSVTPDFESAFRAKALPRFLPNIANTVQAMDPAKFDILEPGDLTRAMGECGGRGEMAPYPDWTARYIVHKDATQKKYILANGDLSGSWPMHIREPLGPVSPGGKTYTGISDGRLVSIDERPQFWFDGRAVDHPAASTDNYCGGYCWAYCSTGRLVPDNAHQPSLAYVPYLMTGDRYYSEEMAFWANFSLLLTAQDPGYNWRGGSEGLLNSNEPRSIAWTFRNIVDAAVYMPDNDPIKAYLSKKVQNNLVWFDNYAKTHTSPLSNAYFENHYQYDYNASVVSYGGGYAQIAWAIDRGNKLGFTGGLAFRDKLAQWQLKCYSSNPDYPRNYGATPLWMIVGRYDSTTGKLTYFSTMKEVYTANAGNSDTIGYCHWVRLSLVIALENGWSGARAAYDYNYGVAKGPLSTSAGWAIVPDTSSGTKIETADKSGAKPRDLTLSASPNPFNPAVVISVGALHETPLHMAIYNINGRMIADLTRQAHNGSVWWDAAHLPSGIYIAKAQVGAKILTKQLILMK